MGLVNTDGNFLVIENIDTNNVRGSIYEDEASFGNLGPFDKVIPFNFNFGADLRTKFEGTTALGTGGRSVWVNMVEAAEALLVEKAAVDPAPYEVSGLNGEWVAPTA